MGEPVGGQPTLEIQTGDVAAPVDEAVLVAAALVRGLVATALDDLRRTAPG